MFGVLLKKCWLSVAVALSLVVVDGSLIGDIGSRAFADDDAAVSGINGKLTAFGGGVDDEGVGGIIGSLTLPVGHSFGLQLDGAAASVNGDAFGGGAAHLFWRNPEVAMLGLFGSYSYLDAEGGIEVARVGLEAQYFMDNLTLDSAVGYRFGDADEEAYGRAALNLYATDDWLLSAGYSYDQRSFGTFKTEYQFATDGGVGASIFGQGQVHDKDRYAVYAGFKFYFGSNRSLIGRHRREDPPADFIPDITIAQSRAGEIRQSRQSKSSGVVTCQVAGVGDALVTSPADGACTCPAGTDLAGGAPDGPILTSSGPFSFLCNITT